jgi:2-iminobutanoate/2-iminopropanoate deaminase
MLKKVDLHKVEEWTYSAYVVAGDFIYTAHIGGVRDEQGNKLDTIEEQTKQSLENLKAILEQEGVTLNDVVKTTVYLKNIDDFKSMRDIYRDYFSDGYPARMTATTEFIEDDCLIQVVAVAYKF